MDIKKIIKKNKMIIKYFLCSLFCFLIEFVVLFLGKRVIDNIVIANTIAIILSSIVHYFITSKYVFGVKKNFKSILVYLITFFIGMAIQDGVIYITYEKIFVDLIDNNSILTIFCKILSLASSFFITFFLRKLLNKRFSEEEKSNE